MKKKTTSPQVIVVWGGNTDGESYNTLCYQGPNSGVRVYDRDRVDPRSCIDGMPPYFDRWEPAKNYMDALPGLKGIIQLDVTVGRTVGLL